MNKNIVILFFLSAMIGCAVYSRYLFNEVERQKKVVDSSEAKLKKDSVENALLAKQNTILQISFREYIASHPDLNKTDGLDSILFKLKVINNKSDSINNKPIYDQALQLEREGFTALINNQFSIALSKFTAAEKTSPSFHMCYEISKLLKNRQADFGNSKKEEDIKIQIYKKYSWKAPKDLLFELGEQLAP